MKIESIRIRNLASLSGTQESIDFGPQGIENGLVAITGATGSGKSTIIDAVCLALYGTTPRLNKVSGDKLGKQEENLLSRGCSDAFAEVDFQDKNGRPLTSRWAISKSERDNITKEMKLWTRQPVEHLAVGPQKVHLEIKKILGMDFEQFNGVVVLSQGSFSSFLKGEKKNRSALLERLTGTRIYGELSKAAFLDAKEKDTLFKKQQDLIGEVDVLPNDEREQHEATLKALTLHEAQLKAKTITSRQYLNTLTDLQQLKGELFLARERHQKAEQNRLASEPQRQQQHQANQAEPLRVPLDRADQISQKLHQTQERTSQQQKQHRELEQHVESSLRDMVDATGTLFGTAHALEQECQRTRAQSAASPERCAHIKAQMSHIVEINQRLERLQQQQSQHHIICSQAESQYQQSSILTAKAESAFQKQEAQTQQVKQTLLTFEQQYGDIEHLVRLEHQLDHLEQLCNTLNQCEHEKNLLQQRLRTDRQALTEQQKQFDHLHGLHEERQLHLTQASKAHDALRLISDLADHRHQLNIGSPCPLCLNTVESFPEDLSASELKASQSRLDDATSRLQATKVEIDKHTQSLHALEARIHEQEQTSSQQDATHSASRSELLQKLNASHLKFDEQPVGTGDAPLDLVTIKANIASKREHLKTQQQHHQSILKELKHAEEQLKQRQTALDAALKTASEHRILFEKHATEQQSCAQQKEDLTRQQSHQQQSLQDDVHRLAQDCGVTPPPHNQAQASTSNKEWQTWLKEREQAYHAWHHLDQTHREHHAFLQELKSEILSTLPAGVDITPVHGSSFEVSQLKADLKHTKQTRDRHRKALEQRQASQVKLKSMDTEMEHLKQEAAELETVVQQALLKAQLPNRDVAKATLMPITEKAKLDAHLQALDGELKTAHEAMQILCKKETTLLTQLKQDAPLQQEELELLSQQHERHVDALEAQHKEALEQLGSVSEKLKHDEKQRIKIADHHEKLKQLERDVLIAKDLNDLIGQADGEKFREFAQTLTLDQLVHYANHRLSRFKPRYSLATRPGLTLDVIDHDQADERRPVSTLSGGESFLVSLALALGLADFRRGSSSIKSVFIDEGFGSLDEGSLESALVTLEHVQHELDAQIIVISHVGELQDRWDKPIHVKPQGHGRSWLVIPGKSERPSREVDFDGIVYQPQLDLDPIEHYLIEKGSKQTGKSISEGTGTPYDRALKNALKADDRFKLEGKSWSLVAWEAKDIRLEPSND